LESPGIPLIYTSATLSLAALEFLVHLGGPQDAPELVFFRVEFEARFVTEARLPKNWRKLKLRETRALGRRWVDEASSPVLRVPSFVVPSESNFVLNPVHRDFRKLRISRATSFALDRDFTRVDELSHDWLALVTTFASGRIVVAS